MRRSSASRDAGFGGRRVLAGGGTALAVIFAFVAANALWYQPHAHKSPILSTRSVHLPQSARETGGPTETARGPETATRDDIDDVPTTVIRLEREVPAPAPGDPLVADIQQVMAELGLYEGEIDGLAGPMTRAAIGWCGWRAAAWAAKWEISSAASSPRSRRGGRCSVALKR